MDKIIKFEPTDDFATTLIKPPISSKNKIPTWFKNDSLFSKGENNYVKAYKNQSIGTYKLCVPVVDAVTSGYTVVLSASVLVTNRSNDKDIYDPYIQWGVHWQPLESKPPEMLSNYPVPHEHYPGFFRWITYWGIKTPPGYSLLITHPHHRYDLPFLTTSAVVDTDKHPNSLELAFFLRNGFEGIIEEGTPIAQILPFKREPWDSEILEHSDKVKHNRLSAAKIDFIRTYKNRFWSKKVYK